MGTRYRVTVPILSILGSTISTACHFSSSGTWPHRAHMFNSLLETHVSEMQLWFVTVSSNETQQDDQVLYMTPTV